VLAQAGATPRCARTVVAADLREHSPAAAGTLVSRARAMPGLHEFASLWKGGLGPDAPGWLTGHGWLPRLHSLAEVARSYGREFAGSGGFLTAVRG
jgi:hypothetical protein